PRRAAGGPAACPPRRAVARHRAGGAAEEHRVARVGLLRREWAPAASRVSRVAGAWSSPASAASTRRTLSTLASSLLLPQPQAHTVPPTDGHAAHPQRLGAARRLPPPQRAGRAAAGRAPGARAAHARDGPQVHRLHRHSEGERKQLAAEYWCGGGRRQLCAPGGDGRQGFATAPGTGRCSSRRRPFASLQLQQRASSCSPLADTSAQVINNLAALRAAVDEDAELAEALPTAPRRKVTSDSLPRVQAAAEALWDDIYTPHSAKLVKILGKSHPDLPVFIIDGEYGPLFSPPASFAAAPEQEPAWEVGRLRTSLVAVAALRAQGGVGPQVTSHIWGLLKAAPAAHGAGQQWLCTEEGALWVVRTVDKICQAVEQVPEDDGPAARESKL
ncbi:hypothetical protein FA09DRAFT_309850, partial [Tilletiopsis washingtonensis]